MSTIKRCHLGLIALTTAAVMVLIMMSAADVRALSDPSKNDKGVTTWDCVYFGHYPQSSDGKGGFTVEPIKWRVLKADGDDAFLMADKNLDAMPFYASENDPKVDCLWHVSTIRSWLNGYSADENQKHIDYTADNFISKAFTASELEAVKTTEVVTDKYTDWHYSWVDQHHYYMKTNDKVYLLEYDEAMDPKYGFTADDEETITRVSLNTAYTAAGGSSGSLHRSAEGVRDSWLLRSPGEYSMYADIFTEDGEYKEDICDVSPVNVAQCIRPVIHLDLSRTDVWSDAGKYVARLPQTVKVSSNFVKRLGDEPFDLSASCSGDSVLEYKSDNEAAASVDNAGRVTINGIGKAVITVTAPQTDSYEAAVKTTTVNIFKGAQEIKTSSGAIDMTLGDAPAAIGAEAKTELSYRSSDESVAQVDEAGNVTAVGAGSCTITIEAKENDQYESAVLEVAVTVVKAVPSITAKKTSFSVKAKALKKKAQTVTFTAKSSSGGKITYSGKGKNAKSKKALKISKSGKITVKKGTKKGSYTMKVTAKCAAAGDFAAASEVFTIKVKIK